MTGRSLHRGSTALTVFGRRAVFEALATDTVSVESVLVDRAAPAPFRKELRVACRDASVECAETSRNGVAALSHAPRHDQGVAATVRLTLVSEAEDFAESLKGARARSPSRLIALDNVTNPQNVGMIIRSALACGIAAILWPTVGAPWVSGLVIKSSAATVYRLPIVRCAALAEGLWTLKRHGFALVGLDAQSPDSLFNHTPAHRACYVVGAETTGITPGVADLLDQRFSIPMRSGVESLNVAVAASLLCFHVAAK